MNFEFLKYFNKEELLLVMHNDYFSFDARHYALILFCKTK